MGKSDREKAAAKKKKALQAARREAKKKGGKGGKKEQRKQGKKDKEDKKKKGREKKGKKKKQEEKGQYDFIFATGNLDSRILDRDVKIGAFSLSAYGKSLIKDTEIELTIGRRYGLIGANGSGKSCFLKCLAIRQVPIPDHIDIFYLEEEAPPSDKTALEYLLKHAKDEVKRLEDEADKIMEIDCDAEALQDIYDRLETLDPNTFEARGAALLTGLGFDTTMMNRSTKDMSGGWRMRVALSLALFIKPMLLLLDEPTNHLDLEACVWLEQYLSKYPYCLMVVSHSQDFLNGVCTNIIEITHKQTLRGWSGNYDIYMQTKKEVEVNQMKKYKKEQDDIKHLKQFISSCGTYSNLVKQAKSKQKILDKMEEAGLTEKVVAPPKYTFNFAQCETLPPPIMSFNSVAFAYSGKREDLLYWNVNFGLDMDSRVALVGPNGAGKSTLLKLMCGDVTPTAGMVTKHLHLNIGRYHQHSTDQLDSKKTVLDFVQWYFRDKKKMEVEEWRKLIGRYGITGKDQTTKIGKLSDGIKTRIVFALLAGARPNLLLLDEPTNHLDMDCIDALGSAINAFEGGLVLVSHDFRLIDMVAKDIWICDHHSIKKWGGDIRSYKNSLLKRMKW